MVVGTRRGVPTKCLFCFVLLMLLLSSILFYFFCFAGFTEANRGFLL